MNGRAPSDRSLYARSIAMLEYGVCGVCWFFCCSPKIEQPSTSTEAADPSELTIKVERPSRAQRTVRKIKERSKNLFAKRGFLTKSPKMTAECKEWALLTPSERPDLVTSLKLGLDPDRPVITKLYKFETTLGRGAFGEVVLGTHIESSRQYAIKKQATSTLKKGDLKRELKILQECKHPNIISLKEAFATEEYVYLVMELANGGCLFDVVVREGTLSESFAAAATMQIASALDYMHRLGVVHRDMKPENVLLSDMETKLIKVCDFGLSKIFVNDASSGSSGGSSSTVSGGSSSGNLSHVLNDREMVMKTAVGTMWYASPELLSEASTYDQNIDLWGLGLVVYILISGKHPFEGEDMYGNVMNGRCSFEEPAWSQVSPSASDLVRKLLRPKPSERISAENVLKHEWMESGLKSNETLANSLSYLNEYRAKEMRHAAFKVLASSLTEDEVGEVRRIFDMIDSDRKGYLTNTDMQDALNHKARTKLGIKKELPRNVGRYHLPLLLRGLHAKAVTDKSVVTFEMFLNAVLEEDDQLVKEHLLKVFATLDHNQNGYVYATDVEKVLEEYGLEAEGMAQASKMLTSAASAQDGGSEGELSYQTFVQVLLREQRECQVTDLLASTSPVNNNTYSSRRSTEAETPGGRRSVAWTLKSVASALHLGHRKSAAANSAPPSTRYSHTDGSGHGGKPQRTSLSDQRASQRVSVVAGHDHERPWRWKSLAHDPVASPHGSGGSPSAVSARVSFPDSGSVRESAVIRTM